MDSYEEIKAVGMDVDGTLTDGVYQIEGSSGRVAIEEVIETCKVTKNFYTRDFSAIEGLMRAGICVLIITQSHDTCIYDQLTRICSHSKFWAECWDTKGLLTLMTGIENKKASVEEFFKNQKTNHNRSVGWDSFAYIGDAENDTGCLEAAAFSGCPADSVEGICETDYYSDSVGGRGAVYDFCNEILYNIE